MREIYDFIFFIAAGISARFLYLAATALAKRTNLLPVTVVLDTLTALSVGGACIAYVILTSAVVAPYMFAALLSGYLFTYSLHDALPISQKTPRRALRQTRRTNPEVIKQYYKITSRILIIYCIRKQKTPPKSGHDL